MGLVIELICILNDKNETSVVSILDNRLTDDYKSGEHQ